MNIQETTALIAYINGLDPHITADRIRVEAWQSFLPDTITYHGAKKAVDHHYSTTRNTIKPKDILDYVPAHKTELETYTGGLKPLCGKCDEGYTRTPKPVTRTGHQYFHVDLCTCQLDRTPRHKIHSNPRSIMTRIDDKFAQIVGDF